MSAVFHVRSFSRIDPVPIDIFLARARVSEHTIQLKNFLNSRVSRVYTRGIDRGDLPEPIGIIKLAQDRYREGEKQREKKRRMKERTGKRLPRERERVSRKKKRKKEKKNGSHNCVAGAVT